MWLFSRGLQQGGFYGQVIGKCLALPGPNSAKAAEIHEPVEPVGPKVMR